jgi:hypothetical protein
LVVPGKISNEKKFQKIRNENSFNL